MLSKMHTCTRRQCTKRFENQTATRPRKWVNSTRLRALFGDQWLGCFAALVDGPGTVRYRTFTTAAGRRHRRHIPGRRSPGEIACAAGACRHGHSVAAGTAGSVFLSNRSALCRRAWQTVATARSVSRLSEQPCERGLRVCIGRRADGRTLVLGLAGFGRCRARGLEPCLPWAAFSLGRSGRRPGGCRQRLGGMPPSFSQSHTARSRYGSRMIANAVSAAALQHLRSLRRRLGQPDDQGNPDASGARYHRAKTRCIVTIRTRCTKGFCSRSTDNPA